MVNELEDERIPLGYLITFRTYGVERGSKRYLWTERDVINAIVYVEYDQGEPLP